VAGCRGKYNRVENMKNLLAVTVLAAMFFSPVASAEINAAEVAAIRGQLLELSRRLDQLEQSNTALRQANAELKEANSKAVKTAEDSVKVVEDSVILVEDSGNHAAAASWAEKIKIKGDFRYRMENIQETGKQDRARQRIRARAAVVANPQEGLELGLGLASGDDDDFFGNSFDPQTNAYLYDYEELELFADLSFTFLNKPALFFADFVQNQDAGEFDTAYAFGLSKYLNASISYYVNEFDGNLGAEKDHDRVQFNLNFKY